MELDTRYAVVDSPEQLARFARSSNFQKRVYAVEDDSSIMHNPRMSRSNRIFTDASVLRERS